MPTAIERPVADATSQDSATLRGSDTKNPTAVSAMPARPMPSASAGLGRRATARRRQGVTAVALMRPSSALWSAGTSATAPVAGALQGAHVGDDRPAVLGAEFVGVGVHVVFLPLVIVLKISPSGIWRMRSSW